MQASRSIKTSAIADGGLIDGHLDGKFDTAFDNPARVLMGLNTEDLASIRENLTPTDGAIKLSKSYKSMDEFIEDFPRKTSSKKESKSREY